MPFDALPAVSAGLASAAYARLVATFARDGHSPSPEQWAAIRDLLEHLERAANGKLEPALYLSAIPAGTGKSRSLQAFAATLMDDPNYAETGMLITVNRLNEAEDMARELGAYRSKLCVITSHDDINGLGEHQMADTAQLCICTQAALKRTLCKLKELGQSFDAASRFHYRGSRRSITAWDEALQFNRPVVLDTDAVGNVAKAMRRQCAEAATKLKQWAAETDRLLGLCSVPDFAAMGVDFERLEDDVADNAEMVAQVKALAVISGDQGFISRQGNSSGIVTH